MRNDIYQRFFLLIGVANLLISCGSGQLEYVNHRKWFTENGYNPMPLKGNPKEVKENFYTLTGDSSFEAGGTRNFYNFCKFDSSGNVVFMRYFLDSNMVADADYTFSKEGVTRTLTMYLDTSARLIGKVSTFISEKVAGNKFKVTNFDNNVYQNHTVTTFLSGGQTVKVKNWNNEKLLGTQAFYYNKGKLIKTENDTESGEYEEEYFYSKEGYLDSIVETNNKGEPKSKIFINNEYGDPVSFTAKENGAVREKHHMKYLYDEKGNWVKEVIVSEIFNYTTTRRFPKYSMVTREIKY